MNESLCSSSFLNTYMPVYSSMSISLSYLSYAASSSTLLLRDSSTAFCWSASKAALVAALFNLGEDLSLVDLLKVWALFWSLLGLICDIIMVDCMPLVDLILPSLSAAGGSAWVMTSGVLIVRSLITFCYLALNDSY